MPQASARSAADPALLASRLLLRLGFAVLAVGVPVTACFSRRVIFVLLPFGTAMILIAAIVAPPNGGGGRLRNAIMSPIGLAVVVLAFWSTLSLLWAPFPAIAAQRLFKLLATLALTTAGVALLPPRMRISTIYLLPVGVALATVVTFVLTLRGLRVSASPETDAFTLERSIITMTILVWPALDVLMARARRYSAAALAAAVPVAAAVAGNLLPLMAVAVGLAAALAVRAQARTAGRVLMFVVLALFMLAPPLPFVIELVVNVFTRQAPDWLAPITIWQDIVANDVPRLLTGHGLETVSDATASGYLPPRVPRSVLFQIWYELGLVGAFATAFCFARGFLLASQGGPATAPYLIGALTTATTLAVFSHNFEQIWWVCLLGVAAICFAGVTNAQYRTARVVIDPRRQRPTVP